MRWFGIDRLKKQGGTWENDIKEIGYKYQMTDLGACILLESLKEFKKQGLVILNAFVTLSCVAVPPTSRKLAGLPP